MESRISDRLVELGSCKEKQDTRRRAIEVLNDLLERMDRSGATSADVDELESTLKGFKRAEILQTYEARCWTSIIEKLRADANAIDPPENNEEEDPPNLDADDDDETDDADDEVKPRRKKAHDPDPLDEAEPFEEESDDDEDA